MTRKKKSAGLSTQAPYQHTLESHFTERLARTKALLVEAHSFGALTFWEAEGIAGRMRTRYPQAWAAA